MSFDDAPARGRLPIPGRVPSRDRERGGTRSPKAWVGAAILALAVAVPGADGADDMAYRATIEKWRKEREARLTSDEGWLTVAGLFWLKEGANTFGSDASNDIVLPERSAPKKAGVFEKRDGRVTVRILEGVTVTSNGAPVTSMDLKDDSAGDPDRIVLGDLTMFVIKRGERQAIRLRDKRSRMRREFTGLSWFPVDASYRVVADFVPYEPPRTIPIPNILGETERLPCPGYASFSLGGRSLRLEPVIETPGDDQLFYIFRDETSGKESYPAGRFLYSDMPEDGKVVLDFNKAYTPPCAFTPYATCPLPPEQNWLPVRIEAGEKTYGHH